MSYFSRSEDGPLETPSPKEHIMLNGTDDALVAHDAPSTLLSGPRLAAMFSSFMLAFSLVSLDQTIISTALPTIASHFNAVSDLSWIASAYFLPQAGLMLFFGRVLVIAPAKPVFLVSVAIFEIGSLFCAVAPSVNFLIFGRAVAGLGGAGIWVAIMAITARTTTLTQRPLLMGLIGAVFATCSIFGPLLGGVFADRVSWRWCFYINLPIGGAALLSSFITLPRLPIVSKDQSHIKAWMRLDWVGSFLSLAATTLLLIPLQWGGGVRPWNDPLVIALIVVSLVLFGGFVVWEHFQRDNAILPLRMLGRRNILGAFLEGFMLQMAFILAIYYLPLLYQLRGHSATRSGIDILPFMISGVMATLVAGGIITKTGYPWPFLFFAPFVSAAGFALLYTVSPDTSLARIAGYQILLGPGIGAAIQNTIVIAQAEFVKQEELVPQATSLMTFVQLLGSAIGIAAGGAVFSGQLRAQIKIFAPDLPPETLQLVLESVKTVLALPEPLKGLVTHAYINAIDKVFIAGIVASALGGLVALLIRRGKITMNGAVVA
ncbi:ABC transporter [Hysterangium stoloniferum]|nr:ABC transporter [Hysterangium stoloniferum]